MPKSVYKVKTTKALRTITQIIMPDIQENNNAVIKTGHASHRVDSRFFIKVFQPRNDTKNIRLF
jgi:hypothetical protein